MAGSAWKTSRTDGITDRAEGNMETIITLEDVSYTYEKDDTSIKAVDNVSLEFYQGEFVGIVGHNGSGKSTLAKLLNGLLLPTSGDVLSFGMNTKDEDDIIEIRKNVGMIFQNPDNQIVATIVEEDVAFGVENLGVEPAEIRRLVDSALQTVDLTDYKDKQTHKLSGGQKQRLAIAGILAMNPKCIVCDESTAMLDPAGRREVLSTLKKLTRENGVTVILITHYMEELIDADRIIAMKDGAVVFERTPKETFSDAELLRELRLDVPEVVEIAEGLRAGGIDVRFDALTAEELVEELCRLK